LIREELIGQKVEFIIQYMN
jgi:endonuclease YncB( thermonuclease family)